MLFNPIDQSYHKKGWC